MTIGLETFVNHVQLQKVLITKDRISHQICSVRKCVLRNFAKFTGKHICQSLFFNKVAGLRPATLLKKRLWYRFFPLNFAKFLKIPFLQNTSSRLLSLQTLRLKPLQTLETNSTERNHSSSMPLVVNSI